MFLCVSRVRVYTILFAGWSANSKYSLLGSLRALAQTISYEISIALIILGVLILAGFTRLKTILEYQPLRMIVLRATLLLVWLVTALAETNRTPFDHAEGERELVRGFNTEFRSSPFTLIFIAEYLNILFLSLVSSRLLLGGGPFIRALLLPLLTLIIAT